MEPLLATSAKAFSAQSKMAGHPLGNAKGSCPQRRTFKSPTTGRSFDLNEDLAEPLLSQLPVTWEQYFTDDLGRVTGEFVIQLQNREKFLRQGSSYYGSFIEAAGRSPQLTASVVSRQSVASCAGAKDKVFAAVRERRSELAAKMPLVAKGRMQPAYGKAKDESGSGMKRRILNHVEPAAFESAQPIFSTIQTIF